jgi:hypothetical protein
MSVGGNASAGGTVGAGGTIDAGYPPLSPAVTVECLTGTVETTSAGLSYDGRYFAYKADASILLLDRQTGEKKSLSRSLTDLTPPAISGIGNRVLFGASPGNSATAYVWDRITDGMFASFPVGDLVVGVLSYDGRYLATYSTDSSFSDPPPYFQGGSVVVDLETNVRWQASVNDSGAAGNDYSFSSGISDNGQRVVFRSVASNLVAGKPGHRWDAYLYDRATEKTLLASHAMNGGYPASYTYAVVISGDGRVVAFMSQADDIVSGDSPGTWDLFLWDIASNVVTSPTVSRSLGDPTKLVNISTDARFFLFGASADALVPVDTNAKPDAFVYDAGLDRFDLVTVATDSSPLRDGGWPLAFSGDGHVVAFRTQSPELAGDGGGVVTCFSVRK